MIIIKCIRRCCESYHSTDSYEKEKKNSINASPLLPSPSITPVNSRQKSSLRNPNVPIHRSSLNLDTQIELRQKRLSQSYQNTPPTQPRT